MKLSGLALGATALLAAGAANAEYIEFNDIGAGVTASANGFISSPLVVNDKVIGGSWTTKSFAFAEGTPLTFSGIFTRSQAATNEDTTYLFVAETDPATVLAQLQLDRTAMGGSTQKIEGTFWGAGSRPTFAAIDAGTVIKISALKGGGFGFGQVIDGNLHLGVSVSAPVKSPVPEPATWLMMIAGFAAAGAALRRTRRPVAA